MNVKETEKFLNLNRNEKYRITKINWEITFNLVKGTRKFFETDYQDNKFRRRKIQLMIEEIPTIEQVKKSLYSLYKNRKCPLCDQEDETFNHVFLCEEQEDNLEFLIELVISSLLDIINKDSPENERWEIITRQEIEDLDSIWSNSYDASNLTFIDIIKGFIPLELTDLILTKVKKKTYVENIINEIQIILLNSFWKGIWLPRCKKLEEIDKTLNIDKKVKKENYNLEHFSQIHKQSNIEKYSNQEGLINKIKYGCKSMDFIIVLVSGYIRS
jgi:hypothetical protein